MTQPDTQTQALANSRSGVDLRKQYLDPMHADASVTISGRLVEEKIQAIHCRLLLAATSGRLTWRGDKIVRLKPLNRVYPEGAFDMNIKPNDFIKTTTCGRSATPCQNGLGENQLLIREDKPSLPTHVNVDGTRYEYDRYDQATGQGVYVELINEKIAVLV